MNSRACGLQQLWLRGSVVPQHVRSSRTRGRTRVPCIGRQIPIHCTTREVSWPIRMWLRGGEYCMHEADLFNNTKDFPGGPVAKSPGSQCRGPGFDPWSEKQNKTKHSTWTQNFLQWHSRSWLSSLTWSSLTFDPAVFSGLSELPSLFALKPMMAALSLSSGSLPPVLG